MKLKRVITTMVLTLTLMVTTMMPTFAASNVESFHLSFKGQNGTSNGLKNGKFHHLDKGTAQINVTYCKNVSSTKPCKISLHRYRSSDKDLYYGTISVSSKGTSSFSTSCGVSSNNYYLKASGGVEGELVQVKGSLQNK